MPQGIKNVHVSRPLTDFAIQYMQKIENFIATQIPAVKSAKLSDKYFTFDRTNWQIADDLVSPGSEANRVSVPKPSTDSYNIEMHALTDYVPWVEIEEADAPLMPKQDTTEYLAEKILINHEVSAAQTFFTTTAVATGNSTSLAAASKWDYTSTTSPIADIDTGMDTVQSAAGVKPNIGIMGHEVWKVLKRHATMLDLIKYTQTGIVSKDLAAAVLDLDKVYVGSSLYMSTDEGISSEATSYIWGKNVLLSYMASGTERANKKRLSHGYRFVKSSENVEVREWDELSRKSTAVEAGMGYDMKVTSTNCGYLIVNAVS